MNDHDRMTAMRETADPALSRPLSLTVILACSVFAILSVISLIQLRYAPDWDADTFTLDSPYPSDALEYHLPAANLALHGRFPVYGFLGQISDYHLCARPDTMFYYRLLADAPAIAFPSKPPLYSFMLGGVYRVFGVQPWAAQLLNMSIWALMSGLLVFAGGRFYGRNGLVAGMLAVALLFVCDRGDLVHYDAELLTRLLVLAAALAGMAAFSYGGRMRHVVLGLMFALLVLAKGYFAFALLLLPLAYAWRWRSEGFVHPVKDGLAFSVALLLLILPWMLHINPMVQRGVSEREEFSRILREASPNVLVEHHSELFGPDGSARHDAVMDIMLFHQYQHAREHGFVVISNQMGDYNILNVHNEYCTDGDFHPEWRIVRSSFHNGLPGMGKYERLKRFYVSDPELGIRITVAKLKAGLSAAMFPFLPAVVVLAILFWKGNYCSRQRWSAAALLLLTVPVTVAAFYADVRFVRSAEGLAIQTLVLAAGELTRLLRPTSAAAQRKENLR